MASATDNLLQNQRGFPRIPAVCPVLYLVAPGKRWHVAKLLDFSATGLRMVCDDNLPIDTTLELQIKPGSQKTVPAITATGRVVRCEVNAENRFELSCKLIKVHRQPK